MDPTQSTTTTTDQIQQPIAGATGVPPEIAARLEAYEKEVRSLREESAARRVKAKEAQSAAEKAAEEQGQYKALADSLKSRVAELEVEQADATQWRDYLARENARLAKVRDELPVHWQGALDAAPTVDGKQAILAAYEAERQSTTPTRAPARATAAGAPPGGTVSHDWQALAADPVALRQARAADPSGWQAFVDRLRGGMGKQQTTQERRLALAKKS